MRRKTTSKASNFLRLLQISLSKRENDYELYSDLLSVESRDIYTTGCLQLESVNLLLEYRLMIESLKTDYLNRDNINIFDLNSYVLDIGGNIGFYARYFSRTFKNVVTLEPNPKTFELLKLNTNYLNNVLALNLGASSASGTKILRGSSKHSGGFKITNFTEISIKDNERGINEYEVQVVTYKDLKEHIHRSARSVKVNSTDPTVIKIDVEGHELEVLKGLNLEFFERLPSILLEINGPRQNREDLIDFLKKMNYKRFVTTTNLIALGTKNRLSKFKILYTIGGVILLIKSFNKNMTVVLDHPQLYRLEQLLVLED